MLSLYWKGVIGVKVDGVRIQTIGHRPWNVPTLEKDEQGVYTLNEPNNNRAIERPELIQLCLNCTKEDCPGHCEDVRKLGGTRNATNGTVQGRKIPRPKNFRRVYNRLQNQKETAAVYRVSINTVRRWMQDCGIPFQKDRPSAMNYKKQTRINGKFGKVKV